MQNGSLNLQAGLFDWFSSKSNGTVWDLNIRPGAKWSDGVPITSADINFTFRIARNQDVNVLNRYLNISSNVQLVRLLNSSESEFVLNQCQTDFAYILGNQYYFPLLPSHIWLNNSSLFTSNNFAQDVTSGPFYHLNYDGGPTLVLRSNPYYWNKPALSEINVTFVSNLNETTGKLQSNQTDIALVDPQSATILSANPQFGLSVEPDRYILYLEYNISNPIFNNTEFRRALAYGINTSAITQNTFGNYATPGQLSEGAVPPSATMWHFSNDSQYSYNSTMARSLLQGQGYTWNNNGSLRFPNGTSVILKIYTDSNVSTDSAAAQLVANYLRALGVKISVIVEPIGTIDADYSAGITDIRNEMVVVSNNSQVFGFSATDLLPGSDVYFPWSSSVSQNSIWLQPPIQQQTFKSTEEVAYSVSLGNLGIYQRSVYLADLLNSEYLPIIVLAYPDEIWAFKNNVGFSGSAIDGSQTSLDMGGWYLNPYAFSKLSISSQPITTHSSETTSSVSSSNFRTDTATSTSSLVSPSNSEAVSSSTSSAIAPPTNTSTYEVITIAVVLVAIAVGTIMSRRRKPEPPRQQNS